MYSSLSAGSNCAMDDVADAGASASMSSMSSAYWLNASRSASSCSPTFLSFF